MRDREVGAAELHALDELPAGGFDSGVTVAMSAADMFMRESGGGLSGNGWVFDVRSSGTSLRATGRFSP